MIEIFLSASVPLPSRNPYFFKTANVLAIREAIKALVEVALPIGRITCGGHPAITPLLALFVKQSGAASERVTFYQSRFIDKDLLPPELSQFADIQFTPKVDEDRGASLRAMRRMMIDSRRFDAAVAIGGMEGVLEEMELFRERHRQALILPVASTGAAAGMLFDKGDYDEQLKSNLTYVSLFRRMLLPLAGGK